MTLLSVLDQSPIRTGATPADAVRETLALAETADRLGYHRYWVAEHHNSAGLAGAAPEILIGEIASRTRNLRVGSGGVMLSHYSALKVAECFRMLELLHPGRIDLGIGRAPGSDGLTASALQHGPGALGIEHFPAQIRDVIGYLYDEMPEGHPFHQVRAMPQIDTAPALWLLGSSDQSGAYAAHFVCAFSFAHFINHLGGEHVVRAYRTHFQPSPALAAPLASIAVFCVCAETEEKAAALRACRELWMLRLYRGELRSYPTVEEALSHPYSPRERAFLDHQAGRTISGTPAQVRAQLDALAREYEADEFVVVTICPAFEDRVRSYELLADAFALRARAA